VGIIRVEPNGTLGDEFVTLVNPERDLGPTHIHGITARDVVDAPRFAEIAGDIVDCLSGSVFVAHNVGFDWSFLDAEFARLGYSLPATASLCTMRLAQRMGEQPPSYKLSALCKHFSIPTQQTHSALEDARATSALLRLFLQRASTKRWLTLADLGCDEPPAPPEAWPRLPSSGTVRARERGHAAPDAPYLSRLMERLAPVCVHESPNTLEYADLLNRVLEDRLVTKEEASTLLDVATRCELSADDVRRVHRDYLETLVLLALEDHVITDVEKRDIAEVASLLRYDVRTIDRLIDMVAKDLPLASALARKQSASRRELLAGKSVCFTGESIYMVGDTPLPRPRAEQLAAAAGLIVRPSVTKKLDLLVVADPSSLSGKARKARDYGTRTMAETVFWQTLGIDPSL
jgi:DNA polymerase III epsilon subunit-like protein